MVREYERIRAVIMRGGTSKAVFLLENELPRDPALRDRVVLAIFGSPDPRQIDGLGGADPLTSRVAIISRSRRPEADVDYTFGYVCIDRPYVDYQSNCGNILQAVGPFAVDEGLVPAAEPVTLVRIFNTNTGALVEAAVPVRDGKARTEGDFVLDGVPGSGARIELNFLNASGRKTGKLLPTGNVVDQIQLAGGRRVRASLVDAANPVVFVQAAEIGLTGKELPQDAAATSWILELMEEIRVKGALLMGMAKSETEVSPALPKVAIVAPPQDYHTLTGRPIKASECDLLARTKALGVMHKAYAVTGGICLGAAAMIPGTVVNEIAPPAAVKTGQIRVGHPSGVTHFSLEIRSNPQGDYELIRAAVGGTARRIMDGYVYVPRRVFQPGSISSV